MIITIGRQFGSGGKEIGEKVAQRLGYAFYDKEILTMAAEENGFSAATMQHYDEKPTGSLIYSLYMTGAATGDDRLALYVSIPSIISVLLIWGSSYIPASITAKLKNHM